MSKTFENIYEELDLVRAPWQFKYKPSLYLSVIVDGNISAEAKILLMYMKYINRIRNHYILNEINPTLSLRKNNKTNISLELGISISKLNVLIRELIHSGHLFVDERYGDGPQLNQAINLYSNKLLHAPEYYLRPERTQDDVDYLKSIRTDERARVFGEYVYFIRASNGPIKIGISVNPNKRLAALRTSNYDQLDLLAVLPGNIHTEQAIHDKFSEFRLRGEWFSPDESLLDYINNILAVIKLEPQLAKATSSERTASFGPNRVELD